MPAEEKLVADLVGRLCLLARPNDAQQPRIAQEVVEFISVMKSPVLGNFKLIQYVLQVRLQATYSSGRGVDTGGRWSLASDGRGLLLGL